MNIYTVPNYKEFLRLYIRENRQRGLISKMAKICGCDRTYLSQVLNGKADLTPDHLIQFCDSMSYTETEIRYLLLLLLRDRSSTLVAKKSFQTKMDQLKKEALVLTNKIQKQEKPGEIREDQKTLYYSSWLYGAAHILTSIPAYQTANAIADKLQISLNVANKILRDLSEMQAVVREKDRFIHSGSNIYLPHHSPQSLSNHLNWRLKSVERSFNGEDVHYTNIFSVSNSDVEKLRHQIVQMIEVQRKLVKSSGTDAACAFCCDFFVL